MRENNKKRRGKKPSESQKLNTSFIVQKVNRKLKYEVYSHYSKGQPKCACCGERDIRFLSIDHIGGGGMAHRKSITKTGSIASPSTLNRWLRQNGYPPEYQVLCMNCNCAKYWYGICPHQAELDLLIL